MPTMSKTIPHTIPMIAIVGSPFDDDSTLPMLYVVMKHHSKYLGYTLPDVS